MSLSMRSPDDDPGRNGDSDEAARTGLPLFVARGEPIPIGNACMDRVTDGSVGSRPDRSNAAVSGPSRYGYTHK
jgi:hypothetical protein